MLFLVLLTPTVGVFSEFKTVRVSSPYSFATLWAMHFCKCKHQYRQACKQHML